MTAGRSDVALRYSAWSEALAEVVYPVLPEPAPVYLDLEDEVLSQLGPHLGLGADPDHVMTDLINTVSGTVGRRAGKLALFAWHDAHRPGSRRRPGPPPSLPLLAVFSLAAEKMGAGDGMGAHNYYGRLSSLLDLSNRRDDVAASYRTTAPRLWQDLNRWLTDEDGRHGLPTAYAIDGDKFHYVGLAISQALVRTGDRARLTDFFRSAGLAPRTVLDAGALDPVLDTWISQVPTPATRRLLALWGSQARDRVVDAACVMLSEWDGRPAERDAPDGVVRAAPLRLVARIGSFLARRLEVGILAYLLMADQARDVHVMTSPGAPVLRALPTGGGPLLLSGSESIDLDSLLDARLICNDDLTGEKIERQPRRVVPLRLDTLLQQHVEVDQAVLGEDLMLFVERSLLEQVQEVLHSSARPGWSLLEPDTAGAPARYAVVRDVQLLRIPDTGGRFDLAPLVPVTRSQVVISGGFAVPGRIRRWSTAAPPEVRVVDEVGTGLRVELHHARAEGIDGAGEPSQALLAWDAVDGVLVADLSEADLTAGDYEVRLIRDTDTAVRARSTVRLRSGDEPDAVQWSLAPGLGRALDRPAWVMTAAPIMTDCGDVAQGACTPVPPGDRSPVPRPPHQRWWLHSGLAPRRPGSGDAGSSWRLPSPGADSCMFTGQHYLEYPTVLTGRGGPSFIQGTCRDCGITKRGAAHHRAARKRDLAPSAASTMRSEAGLPPIAARVDQRWDIAVDVLQHLGGGAWTSLRRVAQQLEPTELFVDRFGRHLEALGHIDVQRDPESAQPLAWEITPSTVAGLDQDDHVLCGYWPASLRDDLIDAVEALGGLVTVGPQDDGPTAWFVRHLDDAAAQQLTALGVQVVPSAARRLAGWLPPLSTVIADVPARSIDLSGADRFAVMGARWMTPPTTDLAGAYRVRQRATSYLLRTHEDAPVGRARRVAVHLAKHGAALGQGRVLAAYDAASCSLAVPRGADLPGAYGRCAVLSSGFLPTAERGLLVYPDVPADLAALVLHRLAT